MIASSLFTRAALLTVAALALAIAPAQAVTFRATLNTASLVGNAAGPFSLDFSFTDGAVLNNNTVTLSNFVYTGGAATGSSTFTGSASGSFAGTVSLGDGSFFNDAYQGFTGTTTAIRFDVSTTDAVDGATAADPTDLFSVSILDSSLNNITTAATDGISLFTLPFDFNLKDTGNLNNARASAGTGAYSAVTTSISAIPEPSSTALALGGLSVLAALIARRQRRS